jgi:hypothetical protein
VLAGEPGWIRIEPHAFDPPDPITVKSPATFYVTVIDHKTIVNPQLLLVTSKACLNGLSDGITISWDWDPYVPTVELIKDDFNEVDPKAEPKWIPPEGDGFGKVYEADSLASHLESGEDTIWYCYVDMPVDGNQITDEDEYVLTITVPSTSPRVLVYVFGVESKVPPTRPGFIIPEFAFGTILAVASMIAALLLRGRFSFKK